MTMQPNMPEKFEEELCGHLSAQLEGQRGRAAAAFRAHLEGGGREMGVGGALRMENFGARRMGVKRFWTWAGVPSAMAAGLAVMVTLMSHGDGTSVGHVQVASTGPAAGGVQVAAEVPEVNQVVMTRDVEDGTTVQNNVPMKVVRQQTMRQMQWFDPREHATYKLSEPGETVNYVQIQPY